MRIGRAIAATLLAFMVWAFWISRDTHPVAEFVATPRRMEAVLPHAAVGRFRVGASHVWDGVPQTIVASAPAALADGRGLPDWVVGNLIGGSAVVIADDVGGWSDAVFLSRMTRAGCVLERALRWRPSNHSEWAGGLYLRNWKPGGLYYAVRGRTLLASPSREAIVAALTLTPERRVAAKSVKAALSDTGSEDARGTWTLAPGSELGRAFDEIRFAVRVDKDEAVAKLRASFRPEVAAALEPYWGEMKPVALAPVFEGPLTISANFGSNIEQTWRAFSEMVDLPWLTRAQWEAWRAEGEGRSAAALLTGLIGPMGPSIRLTWQGIDLDEMAPAPILIGALEGKREASAKLLATLPKPDAAGAKLAEARVTYDGETGRVEAPLMSGPAMTPLGQWAGDTLFFSTSAAAAPAFIESGRSHTRTIEKPANVYVRIDPAACMKLLIQAGRDLADAGMLRGETPESFEKDAAGWRDRAAALDFIEGTASVTNKQIELELRVKCRAK